MRLTIEPIAFATANTFVAHHHRHSKPDVGHLYSLGAWDEGKHSEHAPACRLGDGDCTCPNPYQPEGETHE